MSSLTKEQKEAYGLIPDIKATWAACVKSGKDMVNNAMLVGEQLLQMKELLPHGEFRPLVEERFEFSYDSACDYMKLAGGLPPILKKLGNKVTVEDLSIRGGLKLIKDNTPKKPPKGGKTGAALPESPTPGNSSAAHEENSAPQTATQETEAETESDDPIGDNCQHEWDDEGDCKKCKMPKPASPPGGINFNPADWEGDGKDGTGKDHDGDMAVVFKTAADFGPARQNLVKLKQAINRLKDLRGGELIQKGYQRIMSDLDNLDTEIKFAQPFAPCCYCKSKDDSCKACKGMGWLNKSAHEAAPKEKKRATA